nr:putative serine/threonine/dual specificity protein kinase, catalytic domain-containing protein [Tanacetum cinerariifolium]
MLASFHYLNVSKQTTRTPLSWVQRLKICIGAARALDYLHTGTGVKNRIIHRDVKSSNILLDENMAAKVSDLGVSKIGPVDQPCTHVSTDVKGSFGYFDPNYFMTRRLTRKSDVYSFGVVLFEVLSGRPAVDPSLGDDELGLVGWAQRNIKEGTLNDIIDLNMRGLTPCSRMKIQIMPDCLKAFVEIAVKCLQTRPKDRPTMSEVVVALEAALALQERGDYLVCSRYDNGEQISSSSYSKSGKIMTLSRMLRNILPAKTPVRPDVKDGSSLGKKKKQHRWLISSKLSKKVIPSESGASFQEVEVEDSGLKKFSLDNLKVVTRNFSDDMVVGEGAFGKVFKGWVEPETYVPSKVGSGIVVAIKKLDLDGYQGIEEWQKGDLDSYILKQRYGLSLPWSMRVKIMIGTAQGIAYLHTEENQIIYRDLKTSNILLDQNFNAKIADFGLARHGPINGDTHLSTQVMGTHGYAAPEYIATGYLNGKNDIYAFGVVLLETLTGLR